MLGVRLRRVLSTSVSAVKVLAAVHLFNSHIAELRPCSGPSMYPTLSLSGDLILNSPLALTIRPLQRGALVTAVSPLNPTHQVLKRVIGLPGDTVMVDPSGERGEPERWVKVPRGSVWLAGDNASNSIDSRDYGPVPEGLLRGVVVAKVYPTMEWVKPNLVSTASIV